MKPIEVLTPSQASSQTQEIFAGLQKKFGKVFNVYAVAGNSPIALKAILSLGETLRQGEFNAREVEVIALASAQINGCD